MGRWMQKIKKRAEGAPTKPTEPSFVGFEGIPAHRFQEKAPVGLAAADDNTTDSPTWLQLLALADGRVIQRTGDQDTVNVEQETRLRHGDNLRALVGVPGYERPLTDEEVVKALAGSLTAAPPALAPSSAWLERVARLLGTRPTELLEGGHLEQCDLAELAGTDALMVADTIRHSPAWINRSQRIDLPVEEIFAEDGVDLQTRAYTAATASVEWVVARDQFYHHLMTCQTCHAPTGRYCVIGTSLCQRYDNTRWETNK